VALATAPSLLAPPPLTSDASDVEKTGLVPLLALPTLSIKAREDGGRGNGQGYPLSLLSGKHKHGLTATFLSRGLILFEYKALAHCKDEW